MLLLVSLFAVAVAFSPSSALVAQEVDSASPPFRISSAAWPGQITVERRDAEDRPLIVATIGDFGFRVVLDRALPQGATLVIDPGKVWFSNPDPLVKAVQVEDSEGPHHLSLIVDDQVLAASAFRVSRQTVTGKAERYRFVVYAPFPEGLEATVVELRFENTTAPILAGAWRSRAFVLAGGELHEIETSIPLSVRPGPTTTYELLAPSQAVIGQSIALQLVGHDRFGNVTRGNDTSFRVEGLDAVRDVHFPSEETTLATFDWVPENEGVYFPQAVSDGLVIAGGPIRVTRRSAPSRVYWGDLHSHSGVSKDGLGGGAFSYARDVTRLDFFAAAEHADADAQFGPDTTVGIHDHEWQRNIDQVRSFYEPGHFVTILAYECSLSGGHHNVYFRGLEGTPWTARSLETVDALWRMLVAGQAFTVPHHLGIQWGSPKRVAPPRNAELQAVTRPQHEVGGPALDWTKPHDQALRPALEIYSGHGQSERFDRDDPLAYGRVLRTHSLSKEGPHYARDAWRAGHRMGALAASDDHVSMPGRVPFGLTAVVAEQLTREAIFDALLHRHTWATTGERILLEFELGGATMGQQVTVDASTARLAGRLLVLAPRPIESAEVLAVAEGGDGWETLVHLGGGIDPADAGRPGGLGQVIEQELDLPLLEPVSGGVVYYLRVELTGEAGGRVSRAWSSPIWVDVE